jgi:hypothetical protein
MTTDGDRVASGGRHRVGRWVRSHKFPVSSTLGGLAALAAIVTFFTTSPFAAPGPEQPELRVASFDVGAVSRPAMIDGNGYTDETERETARVQIGFRNTGDAPAFLTEAIVTVREYVPLETCLAFGDALYVTDSVDVQLPYELSEIPWVTEVPVSFRVAPNEVDRMELTFSVPDLPPFVQPVAASLDITVRDDVNADPLPVGTARVLLPASNTFVALEALTAEPVVEPASGCNERNLETLQGLLATPALERSGTSRELELLMDAIGAWTQGEHYVFPSPSTVP